MEFSPTECTILWLALSDASDHQVHILDTLTTKRASGLGSHPGAPAAAGELSRAHGAIEGSHGWERAPLWAMRPAIIESILQQWMFRRLLHPAGRRGDATGYPSSPRRPAAQLTGQI